MSGLRGVSVWSGGVFDLMGGWVSGLREEAAPPPPEMATVAVGTHHTGMHSCLGVNSNLSIVGCLIRNVHSFRVTREYK